MYFTPKYVRVDQVQARLAEEFEERMRGLANVLGPRGGDTIADMRRTFYDVLAKCKEIILNDDLDKLSSPE